MKMLQFSQLNGLQRKDAIEKMLKISRELNIPVAGVRGDIPITEAIDKDNSPDADFIFNEFNDTQVDVIYRENS